VLKPANGDVNAKLGVYRYLCYGEEIVIAPGSKFPDCPKHSSLPTIWRSVTRDEKIPHVTELFPDKKKDLAA
jgi:hypothetical protein